MSWTIILSIPSFASCVARIMYRIGHVYTGILYSSLKNGGCQLPADPEMRLIGRVALYGLRGGIKYGDGDPWPPRYFSFTGRTPGQHCRQYYIFVFALLLEPELQCLRYIALPSPTDPFGFSFTDSKLGNTRSSKQYVPTTNSIPLTAHGGGTVRRGWAVHAGIL